MAGVVTAVAVVVLVLVGYPLFGLFLAVGVALGTLNMWLAVRSVARFATSRPSKARFSGSVLGRLAVITVVALVMAWLVRPAGIAVFGWTRAVPGARDRQLDAAADQGDPTEMTDQA